MLCYLMPAPANSYQSLPLFQALPSAPPSPTSFTPSPPSLPHPPTLNPPCLCLPPTPHLPRPAVYRGTWRGSMVAIKVVDCDRRDSVAEDVMAEAFLSKGLVHDNIVRVRACMQWCKGGVRWGQGTREGKERGWGRGGGLEGRKEGRKVVGVHLAGDRQAEKEGGWGGRGQVREGRRGLGDGECGCHAMMAWRLEGRRTCLRCLWAAGCALRNSFGNAAVDGWQLQPHRLGLAQCHGSYRCCHCGCPHFPLPVPARPNCRPSPMTSTAGL